MTHRIAFYGTLLREHGAQDLLGIREACTFVETCTLAGRLYDLGGYPAFVDGDDAVYGEVFEVDEDTLAIVDAFEGFDPGEPDGGEYVRERVTPVERIDPVWVYRYRGSLDDARLIASGDYRGGNSFW